MLAAVFEVIFPVIIVASVGVVLGRTYDLHVGTLSKVGLYAFTPALAFNSMMNTELRPSVGLRILLAYGAATAVSALVSWMVAGRWPSPTRRAITASTVLGNNGNFGLPIALLAFGNAGLEMAVVIFIGSLAVMFTVGPFLLGSTSGVGGGLLTVAKLPVTWALVLAGAMRLLHWTLPAGVNTGIEMLADACIPVVLVQLGIQIAKSGRIELSGKVLTAVALRAVVVPLTTLAFGLLFGLDGLALASLMLAAAMPIAVNTLMLAQEYGGDAETVASSVVVSTLLSIPIIVVLIGVLPSILG